MTETIAPPNAADMLSENEAAALLSVSAKTMQNWRWRGEGPRFVKVGARLVRYRRGDIEAFLSAGARGTTRAAA